MSERRQKVVGEKRRVNLRLDEELAEWAFNYATKRGTTVTQLIIDYFAELRQREEERLCKDAEQI